MTIYSLDVYMIIIVSSAYTFQFLIAFLLFLYPILRFVLLRIPSSACNISLLISSLFLGPTWEQRLLPSSHLKTSPHSCPGLESCFVIFSHFLGHSKESCGKGYMADKPFESLDIWRYFYSFNIINNLGRLGLLNSTSVVFRILKAVLHAWQRSVLLSFISENS